MRTPFALPASLTALAAACVFTGCYTQLYTRGYAERSVDAAPAYGYAGVPDSAVDAADSAAAAAQRDTLYRPGGTVIVNNYYRESPYYRGYALDAWDYPYISFGFYSGRYRDYYGPYWWHDGYRRGRYYRDYHDGHTGGTQVGGGNGPYKSDKRIFAPTSPQPRPDKGRRSEPAQVAPAPKASDPAPAESSGSSGNDDRNESSSSSSGASNDHPALHKGKRR
jgi:hypothetical protein